MNKAFLWIILAIATSSWGSINLSVISSDRGGSAWDSVFAQDFPSTRPEMTSLGDSLDRYAWHGHYWLRAYALMAEITGDNKYVDYGMELAERMFYMTDRERWKRGEISTLPNYNESTQQVIRRQWCRANPSYSACTGLTSLDSNAAPFGWKRLMNGQWITETLNDGQITNGMMRFLALIMSDARFIGYRTQAQNLIDKIKQVVEARLSSWMVGDAYYPLYGGGSFYYIRTDKPFANLDWGNTKFQYYSNPLPYNHSATFATTLLLLDSLEGGANTNYRNIAAGLVDYWKGYVRKVAFNATDTAYEWNYELAVQPAGQGVEDMGHGHLDVGFLVMAYRRGIPGITLYDLNLLAKTYLRNYRGNGSFWEESNATVAMAGYDHFDLEYDWIDMMDLTQDSTQLGIARTTLSTQFNACWSRTMLAWANVMYWDLYFHASAPVSTLPQKPRFLPLVRQGEMYRLDGRRVNTNTRTHMPVF